VFGVGVVLAAGGHNISGPERRALGPNDAPVVIGAGSWLGARVVVLPGVHVAPGCVVGAGAVVTRDTEPNGVYVGVPARRVRDL
jgi:acetyltransferase-like isoleucine patch superfamily enzyme